MVMIRIVIKSKSVASVSEHPNYDDNDPESIDLPYCLISRGSHYIMARTSMFLSKLSDCNKRPYQTVYQSIKIPFNTPTQCGIKNNQMSTCTTNLFCRTVMPMNLREKVMTML